MKTYLICILITSCLLSASQYKNIELKNGNNFNGEVLFEDDIIIKIRTEYGDIEIDKNEILNITEKPEAKEINSTEQKLNQEARWQTIYLGMSISNSLYGVGIPYLLDFKNNQTSAGFRLMMFGGSFYGMYRYTENMNLEYGRSQFQSTGALLGGLSMLPVISTIGFDRWSDFDKEGKVSLLYQMIAVPYGIIKADKLYDKWDLDNGQAYMVASAATSGLLNTMLLMDLLVENINENNLRIIYPITYLGAFYHGFKMKEYVQNKSLTESDAQFINSSFNVGFFNWMMLSSIFEVENKDLNQILFLLSTNGTKLLANSINSNYDLKKGQSRIILLGAGASFLFWNGIYLLFDNPYDSNFYRWGNLISTNLGWYVTHKMLTKSQDKNYYSTILNNVSIYPSYYYHDNRIKPILNLNIQF